MTTQPLDWGTSTFFRVVCRLGKVASDTPDDADSFPNRMTQGGSVVIRMAVERVKYLESDSFWRSLSLTDQTYTIQAGTGELVDQDGNIGAWLLNPYSAGIDPVGYTYEAKIIPNEGQSWTVSFSGPPLDQSQLIDLVRISPTPASTGTTGLAQKVAQLESAPFVRYGSGAFYDLQGNELQIGNNIAVAPDGTPYLV